MNMYYVTSNHYTVPKGLSSWEPSDTDYELRAEIRGKEIRLQGAYNRPGEGTRTDISDFTSIGLPFHKSEELLSFVSSLPANTRMHMNAMIVHICTVYDFLHGM